MTNQPLTVTETITEVAEQQELISTFHNYGLTWFAYIFLVALMVGLIWYALRKRHFILNWFITSIVLAGSLSVGHPSENTETYSPLVLNSMVKLFDDDKAGFISGLKTIGLVWVILFVLGIGIWFAYQHFIANKKSSEKIPAKKTAKESKMATPIEPKIED